MGLHRPLGDAQLGPHLLVQLPVDEPLKDLLLPDREARQSLLELEQPCTVQPLGLGSRQRLVERTVTGENHTVRSIDESEDASAEATKVSG